MKIDEKTVVPLGWMIGGLAAVVGATIVGAFWVFSVDARLGRIEQKLGIEPYVVDAFIGAAKAGQIPLKKGR